jgi:hypothetical protein
MLFADREDTAAVATAEYEICRPTFCLARGVGNS